MLLLSRTRLSRCEARPDPSGKDFVGWVFISPVNAVCEVAPSARVPRDLASFLRSFLHERRPEAWLLTMGTFLLFAAALWFVARRLSRRLRSLEDRHKAFEAGLDELHEQVTAIRRHLHQHPRAPEVSPTVGRASASTAEGHEKRLHQQHGRAANHLHARRPALTLDPADTGPARGWPSEPDADSSPTPPSPSAIRRHWERVEAAFSENWTGILGTGVVVAGVTFLGIYAAIQLAPFYRFLLTLGAAAALGGLSWAVSGRTGWEPMSQWLRAASAAVLLFACAASGGLPGLGLQWIEAPLPGLGLLLAGLVVNLLMAWVSRVQTFAALHVVLSLLPLLLVPASPVSMTIGTAVATLGMMLALRTRWDVHIGAVLTTYTVFHVGWYLRMEGLAEAPSLRVIGFACAALVVVTVLILHYQNADTSEVAAPLAVAVHIGTWGLYATAALVYAHDLRVGSVGLAGGAIVAWFFGWRAKVARVPWLYLCDVLLGQGLAVGAIACAIGLASDQRLLGPAIIFAECVLFLTVLLEDADPLLTSVGVYLGHFAGIGLLELGLTEAFASRGRLSASSTAELLGGALVAVLMQAYVSVRRRERLSACVPYGANSKPLVMSGFGALSGALAATAAAGVVAIWSAATLALLSAAVMTMGARRLRDVGLAVGATVVAVVAHVALWTAFVDGAPWVVEPLSARWVPLVALGAVVLSLNEWRWSGWLGVALVAIDLGIGAQLYLAPVSPLLPGLAWLMLSLLALELANRWRQQAQMVLLAGYGYLIAFGSSYALVVLQTQTYLGPIRVRLAIELFAMAVAAQWWFFKPSDDLAEQPTWQRAHPLLLEAGLLLAVMTVLADVPTEWRPIAWALAALALYTSSAARLLTERSRTYSLAFYWASVAAVALVLGGFERPSTSWWLRPDALGVLALFVQAGYVVAFARRATPLDSSFPPALQWVSGLTRAANRWPHGVVFYPYFAGVALFLFWRFDRSVLTLLWSAEAFVVFALAALLKEGGFRHVALAGLGGCLVRLVAVDMAQANLGLRGLVFVGVGLLMLGMNAIFTRYRSRFQ